MPTFHLLCLPLLTRILWSLNPCSGSLRVITANNDCTVRVLDATNFAFLNSFTFDWSVNVSKSNHLCYLHILLCFISVKCVLSSLSRT